MHEPGHLSRLLRICLQFWSFTRFKAYSGKETGQMIPGMGYAQALPAMCL